LKATCNRGLKFLIFRPRDQALDATEPRENAGRYWRELRPSFPILAIKMKDHHLAQNEIKKENGWSNQFAAFAQSTANWSGHPTAFLLAVAVVIVWILTGPIFHYSNTWQLIINTGTTIVTFLMVFLIQNTQNRDMLAVQIKLSELVLAMKEAENRFVDIEDLSEGELKKLHEEFRRRTKTAERKSKAVKRKNS
jgi:low affinity Fe/Cu permease